MSDTVAEVADHLAAVGEAKRRGGRVRIHGLGLGMFAAAVLKLQNVERVDVVESEPDVVALVAPTLARRYGQRFCVIVGDARELQPNGERYAVVWHDIWPSICADHWPEMKDLHRRWRRDCDWQESWCRDRVRREARGSR